MHGQTEAQISSQSRVPTMSWKSEEKRRKSTEEIENGRRQKKKKSASLRLSRGIEIDDVLLPPLAGATVYYIVFMAFTFCWSGAKFSMLPWLDKQKLPFSLV